MGHVFSIKKAPHAFSAHGATLFRSGFAVGASLFKFGFHLGRGLRGEKRNDHDEDAGDDEGGHKLIDAEDAAEGLEQELPNKDGYTAREHTCDSAGPVDSLPEEGEENDGAEGGAEARPCEGNDLKYNAVFVPGYNHAEYGDEQEDGS